MNDDREDDDTPAAQITNDDTTPAPAAIDTADDDTTPAPAAEIDTDNDTAPTTPAPAADIDTTPTAQAGPSFGLSVAACVFLPIL